MVKKMKKLWIVRESILGCDRRINLYFETKSKAKEYADSTNYTDNPIQKNFPENEAKKLLYLTEDYLNPSEYFE